jgi:hypothetical protein
VGPSGLPIPPGGGVPRPAGAPGGLVVLDWAGFKGAVSWSFDDSQPSHISHYAELQATGVPVTFYISVGTNDEPGFNKTWAQAVKDGHEIGNHAVHHCHSDLSGCSFGRAFGTLAQEVDGCSTYIPAHTPQPATWTAASPFGDAGYDAVARSRFLVNRGVHGGMIGPGDASDPFDLPVHMAASGETAASFDQQIDLAHQDGKWVVFVIHSILPTSVVWYNPVAIGEVTSAMVHGGSMPDVWNDTVVAIAAYWRAQRLLSSITPEMSVVGDARTLTWRWALPAGFPRGRFLRVRVDGGTPTQAGRPLPWDDHGYYEVALDAGALTLAP